jgi:hypothetical protein
MLFNFFKGARKEPASLEELALWRKENLERVNENEIMIPHPLKENLGVMCVTQALQHFLPLQPDTLTHGGFFLECPYPTQVSLP